MKSGLNAMPLFLLDDLLKHMYNYRISQRRILLSSEPERKESSVGFMHSVTTLLLCPRKYWMYLFSLTFKYLIMSFSLVDACTT